MFKSRKEKKITLLTGLGYGLTDVMGGSSGMLIGAYLMYFYTTFVGLSAMEAAAIFASSKLIDSVVSICMGNITDYFYRTKLGKKFGRRRFFLLFGAPLMFIYGFLWINGLNYWFYFWTYVIFDILASVVLIPYETLPSEMTSDFNKRTILTTGRMLCSGFTSSICTIVGGSLIKIMGENNPNAYFVLGFSFSTLYVICILITYNTTWERELTAEMIAEQNRNKQSKCISIKEAVKGFIHIVKNYFSTLKVKAFRQHLIMYLFAVTAQDIIVTVFVYFIVFDLGSTASFASTLLSINLIGVPLTLVWGMLFVKVGPANLLKFCYITAIVGVLGYYGIYVLHLTNSTLIIALIVVSFVFQAGKSCVYFTPWNVFPFIPDVDEIMTGKRREGLFAAVMTFLRKATSGIAAIIIGAMLESAGLVKDATVQPVVVQHAIALTLLIGGGGLTLISLLVAFKFKLNTYTHKILINEIQRLKNNGLKRDVDAKTKDVVEHLTGIKYENVWPIVANEVDCNSNGENLLI
ncbi:MFS transporter [Clostridium sp. SHJSY1]|uniref:MFS transporter n=1 Tax=Clostridium sp. SHJSY1 TaxID=2942483 RepID=UPI002875859B|nr:MFS transporter [Clostridium sp. SHJSY1]MDS0524210.1 MFS transporter [Clostridium sp. SHJSY1]